MNVLARADHDRKIVGFGVFYDELLQHVYQFARFDFW